MSNINKQAREKLKSAEAKAVDNFDPNMFVETRDVLALLDELEAKDKRIAELEALGRGVKQFSEFQICHYGATEDYAKGYIDCQNNYNKVLFAAAGKGE